MKIKFFLETDWPKDKKRERGLDGVEWEQVVKLPALPRVGDRVALNGDDYRKVEEVFIATKNGDVEYEVHFAFQESFGACSVEEMTRCGWKEV